MSSSELTAIEQTAWLTAFCRHWERARAEPRLDDPFATWLAETHPEREPERVSRRTRIGVVLRSALIDRWIEDQLAQAAGVHERPRFWVIGAGLDARWARLRSLDTRTSEHREFDRADLLREKAELIARSPLASRYARVQTEPGDVFETLSRMPATSDPCLIVIEGMLMYLDRAQQERLFGLVREKLVRGTVIADIYSAHAARAANRQRRRILGGIDARFGWGPPDVREFVQQCGFDLQRVHAITPDVFAEIVPWLRVPLPQKLRDSYLLVQLAARNGQS